MKIKKSPRYVAVLVLSSTVSWYAAADADCDAEVVTLNNEIAALNGSSSNELEQAKQMLDVLSVDCASGSSLASVASLADSIRELLGMRARS